MIKQDLERCHARLQIQESAINQIQDYFEYRNESGKDKQYVLGVLDEMVDQFMKLYDKEYEEMNNENS